MKKLLAYLQLIRLPNVFTALADILMGYFVTVGTIQYQLGMLIAASCSLYWAGMVLNDVMDFEIDQQERPHRPLPSGRIDRRWAGKLGLGLLLTGVLVAFLVSPVSGAVALLLAAAIYLYDGPCKQTMAGPWLMGSCRMLNVLLGMSLATQLLQPDHLLIAGGLGVYVAGITWFARKEAAQSDAGLLKFGFAVMVLGIVLLACFPMVTERSLSLRDPQLLWPALLMLLMSSVVRNCVRAIWDPQPSHVQAAVKHSLFTLIILNAATVLALGEPKHALIVLAMILPAKLIGRWIYST